MRTHVPVTLALLAILLVARSTSAQSGTRDILRQRTSAGGDADPALAAETGWETLRGYSYKILLKMPGGSFTPVSPHRAFTTGQSFRLEIEAHNDLWFYILNRGPTGTEVLLLPEKDEEHLLVKRGEQVTIPSDGSFKFTDPPGTEQFRIVASPDKLPWANPRELYRLEKGETLAPGEAQLAARQQETRNKSIDRLQQTQGRLERLDEPLGKVIQERAADPVSRSRAKDTMLRPPPPEGANFAAADVVRASTDANNREPFVHEIRLEHKGP